MEVKNTVKKIKEIAEYKGVLVNGKVVYSALKKSADPHKFTGNAGYKVYLGEANGVGLIEFFPTFAEKNKQLAIVEFYWALKTTLEGGKLEDVEGGWLNTRQKFSVGWE